MALWGQRVWHQDPGQPPAWPRDISHHQPALPGHANHTPRPSEDAILDAQPPTDLPCHSPDPGDQPPASDTNGGHILQHEVKSSNHFTTHETLLRLLRPVFSFIMILALKDLLLATSGQALQDLLLAPADLMSSMSSSIRSLMSTPDKALFPRARITDYLTQP